ncbi:trypsin-like serine peptidase [Streptomyces bohaiensis]|uniref:Trypsin-like peptidase domain-containing protein n=1 Tax=Streptomyces bohaiensis TaxID=1431344 RepID=A0ABX1CBD6_9ACTN|nr:trypsin-like peptidase domain-containing protein [Streptomyces bohaiensis]NJQ14950.1 trypsin-like peptidase domain-containing protein [Streptomyces bohaiensis]
MESPPTPEQPPARSDRTRRRVPEPTDAHPPFGRRPAGGARASRRGAALCAGLLALLAPVAVGPALVESPPGAAAAPLAAAGDGAPGDGAAGAGDGPSAERTAVPPGTRAPEAAPRDTARPMDRTVPSIGKLIWETVDGGLRMCSGAVVESANGSVVATAAHCVQEPGTPEPAEAWFLPGYQDGFDTFRRDGWPVSGVHLPEEWDVTRTLREILPHDYAFLTVERREGRTLQETHGANRLRFAPVPQEDAVTAVGYAAAPPYDGESPWSCTGPTRVLGPNEAIEANVGGLLLEACGLTQGASGGPWLQRVDPETGAGTVVGVTSAATGQGEIVGRPYPAAARALYDAAAGQHRGALPDR